MTENVPLWYIGCPLARALSNSHDVQHSYTVQSFFQYTPGQNYIATISLPAHRVSTSQLNFLALVIYHLNDPFNLDRMSNNGATLTIPSTPCCGLPCLRRPPPSTPPSLTHHSSIQRRIAGNTQIAQARSHIGGNGGGTYLGTSRISCTARFHTARGEEIVPTYSIVTGSKKTTALTMRITAALPRGAKLRHTTHG